MTESSAPQDLPDDLIAYIRGVLEGTPKLPSAEGWFAEHNEVLQRCLTRGSYLRLKQGNVVEVFRKILTERDVSFVEIPDVRLPHGPNRVDWIRPEWLGERVDPFDRIPGSSSHQFDELLRMVELKETGDELRYFETSAEGWKHKCGCAGIALVRGNVIVCAIVTMQT